MTTKKEAMEELSRILNTFSPRGPNSKRFALQDISVIFDGLMEAGRNDADKSLVHDAWQHGYDDGYDDGYEAGSDDGGDAGYDDGFMEGYDKALNDIRELKED